MDSSKKRRTKRQKRRNKRSTVARFNPFPPIPTSMRVCVRARTYNTGTAFVSPNLTRFGMVEFIGQGGSYVDTFLNGGLYKYAIVHASKLTIKVINVGSEPILVASAALPWDWQSGSPTIAELLDHPTAVKSVAGSSTGQDRATIVNSVTTRQVLGKAYQAAKYQMDYTQAVAATPLSNDEPAWNVYITAFNGATAISFRAELEFEWNVEFYNLSST